MGRTITVRVRRSRPGAPAFIESHRLEAETGMTVLDALRRLKEGPLPDLAWRSSCRMGVCGSCGMFVNGRPRLACNTQVAELGSVVEVAALPNFDLIRDLVPDLTPMFDAHQALRPWLIREDREEQDHPSGEYRQGPEEMEDYLQFSYCIKCGACLSACPTVATDPGYSGPMPLAQAHRYNADSRDTGFDERRRLLETGRGPWRCHFAGECSAVCPKGVDPARALQLLRRSLVLDALGLRRRRPPAPLAGRPTGVARRPEIPEAPAPTVTR